MKIQHVRNHHLVINWSFFTTISHTILPEWGIQMSTLCLHLYLSVSSNIQIKPCMAFPTWNVCLLARDAILESYPGVPYKPCKRYRKVGSFTVYLPTWFHHKIQANVGKHIIHGWYGIYVYIYIYQVFSLSPIYNLTNHPKNLMISYKVDPYGVVTTWNPVVILFLVGDLGLVLKGVYWFSFKNRGHWGSRCTYIYAELISPYSPFIRPFIGVLTPFITIVGARPLE